MESTSSFGVVAGWLQAFFGSGLHQSDDAKYCHLFMHVYLAGQIEGVESTDYLCVYAGEALLMWNLGGQGVEAPEQMWDGALGPTLI